MKQTKDTKIMETEAEKVSELTRLAMEPKRAEIDAVPFVVGPNGAIIELGHTLPHPLRNRGFAVLTELPSFARFVERHKTNSTVMFASLASNGNATLRAIFDYCESEEDGGTPGWGEWGAVFTPPLSGEWKAWTEHDGEEMNQRQFAQFLEDRVADVVTPPGATLLEIGKTLSASKNVEFRSAQRLSNSTVQFTYNETVDGVAGASGNVPIPEMFTLGLPMWQRDLKRYEIKAKLRYRLGEGKLTLWFELVNLSKVIEHAHAELLNAVKNATGIEPFMGAMR